MASFNVETWDLRTLTPAQARAIGELLVTIWPRPNVTIEMRADQQLAFGRAYAGSDLQAPRSYVMRDGERVIAHSLIFLRNVGTPAGEWPIAALARVCSLPEMRGHGLGAEIVRAAFARVDAGDFRAALFQTTREVRPFYEKLGAATVSNKIVNSLAEDPESYPFWDTEVMRYPARGEWPAGTIDLRGPGY